MASTTAKSSADANRKFVLRLDGVYYCEALQRREAALKLEPEYIRWEKIIKSGQRKIAKRESKYKNPMDAYDEVEHLVTKLGRDWEDFLSVAKAFIQNAASVHIMCSACLEAHINMRAEERLSGKLFNEFDKLSAGGKWLFYPKIVGAGSFDPGKEPFQSLQKLLSKRNVLMHYKTRINYRRYGFEVPDFVDELAIRSKDLQTSISTVTRIVTRLAKMESRKPPNWLGEYWIEVFDFG